MTREQFENEARNIALLLADHAEYKYRYPAKYDEVKRQVQHQLVHLLEQKSGERFPIAPTDLPLDTMADFGVRSVHKMLTSLRGRIVRQMKKEESVSCGSHLSQVLESFDRIMEKILH